MRLTLLTLMAYLDDVLDPDNAKEIGEKISSSPVAADLAARIKEVCRRRRIRAADAFADDPGFLANSVAEYLDYTLPPDQIPELERKCLNSDERLAEVAACHQILTLFLGKPVDVSDKTRERMYSLVEDRSAAVDAVAGKALEDIPSEPLREVETAGIEAASDNQPGRFQDGIPDYLKPRPLWQRLLPVASIVVVLVVWLFVIFTDSAFQWSPQQVASNDSLPKPADNDDTPDAATNTDKEASNKPSKGVAESTGDNKDNQNEIKSTSVVDNGKPVVPPPPEDDMLGNETSDRKMTANDGNAETSPMPMEDEAKGDDTPPKPAVPKQPIPKIAYSSEGTVLLKRDDLKMIGGWFVLPNGQSINAGDEFISPMPFRTTFAIKSLGLIVKADAHTRFKVVGNTPVAPFGFEIISGRMIFERHSSEDAGQKGMPRTVAMKYDEELWKIDLLEENTIAGIEVSRRLPNHYEHDFGEETGRVTLTVAQGTVKASDGGDRDETISAGKVVLIAPLEASDAVFSQIEGDDLNLLGEDAWLTKDVFRSTRSRRREAVQFEKEFDESESVGMTMPAVYRNPDPHISMFAVQTLALMEKPEDLVTALKTATHEETRQAAIAGLREWLPQNPENREKLKAMLSKVFRPDTDQTVYSLLWGFNKEDGKDEVISRQLVSSLRDENVAVRELAIYHIEQLTGRTYDYRPLAPVNQRDSIAARWEQHIQREGALVP